MPVVKLPSTKDVQPLYDRDHARFDYEEMLKFTSIEDSHRVRMMVEIYAKILTEYDTNIFFDPKRRLETMPNPLSIHNHKGILRVEWGDNFWSRPASEQLIIFDKIWPILDGLAFCADLDNDCVFHFYTKEIQIFAKDL